MSKALHLSHWDEKIPVVIPPATVKDLTNYQIMAIRHLYSCYIKGKKGVILNEEDNMNVYIQISVFLEVLHSFTNSDLPSIIVCNKQSLHNWHYYLSKYVSNEISLISEKSTCIKYSKVVLSSIEDLKLLNHGDLSFFIVTIDDLDLNLNRRFTKQLKGQFHIGLTTRNFLKNPDQKLFRNMILWAVPGAVGKLEEFIKEDDEHLKELRYPYGEWWFRLSWSFCDKFVQPSEEERLSTQASIQRSNNHNNVITKKEEKIRPQRKRKRETKKVVVIPSKVEENDSQTTIICDEDYHTILDNCIDDAKPIDLNLSDQTKQNADVEDEVLSLLLDEPKLKNEIPSNIASVLSEDEDDLEGRNRDVLSLLYGD
ncbi:hypothetical protein FQR65_LT14942 [Abscondita terminalis]|nr:hypothetical protein FQR65_LT14942 [Abscondita terminalis]